MASWTVKISSSYRFSELRLVHLRVEYMTVVLLATLSAIAIHR